MKSRALIVVLVIALTAAIIGGATMAWFTDEAKAKGVTFAAGTLTIAADQVTPVDTTEFNIVNPGDKYCVGWEVENTGTKRAELRFNGLKGWLFDLGNLGDPAHIAICPNFQDDWIIVSTEEGTFEIYYTKGPIEPNDTVKLVLVVAFDGPGMGNDFQEQTFAISGQFEALQTTNGVPEAIWGDGWNTTGSFDLDGYFSDFSAEDWPECCGQTPEPEAIVPGEEMCFDKIVSSISIGRGSGNITLSLSPVRIYGAKDLNGDLLNGAYNLVFLLRGHLESNGYEKIVTFTDGYAKTEFRNPAWTFYFKGSYHIPNDVYIVFGDQ